MSDASTTETTTEPVVLAQHKYGWSWFEILSMLGVFLVPTVFAILTAESWRAIALPIFGLIGVGFLWNMGRHRKNMSALALVDDNGVLRLYRGKDVGASRGHYVTLTRVSDAHIVPTEVGPQLQLNVLAEDGTQEESLRLPARILTPEVVEALRPLLDQAVARIDRASVDEFLANA